jgi:DNA-binding winged helix-turn-helix (wHTH) protein
MKTLIETSYPISFRQKDAKALGEQIKNRHSVVLIGMKRVGISNFLRFFLNHKDIQKIYIGDSKKHLFIPVDLNDLVEREVFPFWVLTQKRILDAVEKNNISAKVKKEIETLFMASIQSQDLFLTIDSVRKSLLFLIEEGFLPTIFFLRYDRMQNALTLEFFNNLQGLVTATDHNLSYVFTSVRELDSLSESLTKSQSYAFAHNIYIKPAVHEDIQTIYDVMNKNYRLKLSDNLKRELLRAVDGYAQYLFFALIYLLEHKNNLPKPNELFTQLAEDERISLQSEELWESLSSSEQDILIKMHEGQKISKEEKNLANYLFRTGIISDEGVFSPLFSFYVQDKIHERKISDNKVELTRKENLFLNLLLSQNNEVCERELIIQTVWPEAESLGVSDWAIDRLVARLRTKLKTQNSKHEIITVKSRGYKLQ